MNKFIFLFFASLSLLACSNPALNQKSKPPLAVVNPASSEPYVSAIPSRELNTDLTLQKIAFGSCANQDWPQPLWTTIHETKPDLFLFMGDNVYASNTAQTPIPEQYRKLDKIPEYLKMRADVPFLVTWDDHDFGKKDGGADFAGKDIAKRDFLNYWAYANKTLPPELGGVYHSKIIGPKNKSVQIIMLDTRYYRSPLKEAFDGEGKSLGFVATDDPNATVLGDVQWKWLEEELKKPAKLRLIVSSIQLIGYENKYEKWGNFPQERQRFFDLLAKTQARNVVVLSGDRHMGIIGKTDIKSWGPLYDVTASSINRPTKFTDNDSQNVGPVYNQENFGLTTIDWKKKTVAVELRDMKNNVVNSIHLKMK